MSLEVRRGRPGWDPLAAVARARDAGADREVLKEREGRLVVRVEGAGPDGEAVVVKYRELSTGAWLRASLAASPGELHWRGAAALAAAGVATPEPLAVVEGKRGERVSAVVCRALEGAETLRTRWLGSGPRGRRRLAWALGEAVAALHRNGLSVPDLRDANLLVTGAEGRERIWVVDLDRWRRRRLARLVRRADDLVPLERTLGRLASDREKLALLAGYRRAGRATRRRARSVARAVERRRRRKDARVARRRSDAGILPDERMAISAIVVCGDEAEKIRGCLESLRWCDELVVVDSCSSDGTWEVVRAYATRAIRRSWAGHRAQKQFALECARHPWVLNVDADERVSGRLRRTIEALLAADGAGRDGFEIPRVVRYLGRWWDRSAWVPDRKLRLLRRSRAAWGGRDPHERATVRGRVGRLRDPLWHLTYDDVSDHVETIDRFTSQWARGAGGPPAWRRLSFHPLARFLRFYLWRGAFREGFAGLFVSISAAVYTFLKYAKQDEAVRRRGGGG